MPLPTSISDLSTTASSNYPAGSDLPSTMDNALRSLSAIVKQNVSKGSDITSASSITIPASGSYFVVTGTTGISTITDTNSFAGRQVTLKFSDALTITHGSGLILPGAANITTVAGDTWEVAMESAGVWRTVNYSHSGGYQPKDADIPTVSASQGEMEAGTEAALRSMSPLRVAQAISALSKVLQVVSASDAGGTTSATGFTNLSTSAVPITPVSDDSTIYVMCFGGGQISAGGAGTNSQGVFQLYNGTTQFGSSLVIGTISGSGTNVQHQSAIALLGAYANSSTASKSFSIQGYKVGGTSSLSAASLVFLLIEVAN